MFNEKSIKIRGHFQAYLNEELVEDSKNLVVDSGLAWIASRLTTTSTDPMSHLAVGTSDVAPDASEVTLQAEINGGRVGLQTVGGSASGATVTFRASFPAGVGTGNIKEAGIFNASSGGIMLNRKGGLSINKTAEDILVIIWSLTFISE